MCLLEIANSMHKLLMATRSVVFRPRPPFFLVSRLCFSKCSKSFHSFVLLNISTSRRSLKAGKTLQMDGRMDRGEEEKEEDEEEEE